MDSTEPSLFDVEPATLRRCKRCRQDRPLAMFYLAAEQRAQDKTGWQTRKFCRLCQREINDARRAPRQAIIDKIKADTGCVDCGLKYPEHPEVFEFDHLPGEDKVAGIAVFQTKGTIEDMLAEIAKCEVVCGNCHRIRTHSRQYNSFGKDRGPEERRAQMRLAAYSRKH